MKYEDCPNCSGKLGVPDKLRGKPVECPVCKLSFVPPVKPRPKQPAKPALRSLPVPTAIAGTASATQAKSSFQDRPSDPVMPPKNRLGTLAPESPPTSATKNPSTRSTLAQNESSGSPRNPPKNKSDVPNQRAVARIIKSELIHPQLTKDGKLPTLNLVDDAQPKASEEDLKRNPVFIALLISFSLVSSGVMIFLVGMQPSLSEKRVAESREEIQKFHEVRVNEELRDYQRELREAQLAHSRQDYKTEISCYGKIMARFHSEDRNKFSGLTGSPTWDNELEEHVSILLNDAKQKLRGF